MPKEKIIHEFYRDGDGASDNQNLVVGYERIGRFVLKAGVYYDLSQGSIRQITGKVYQVVELLPGEKLKIRLVENPKILGRLEECIRDNLVKLPDLEWT